jgi:hypothetical protein
MCRLLSARLILLASVVAAPVAAGSETPLSGAFTYQGLLDVGGLAVTGICDFRFSLWNAPTDGDQIGATQAVDALAVDRGTFTATLDEAAAFGTSAFPGTERHLEIEVRCPAGSGAFSTLSPRQRLTAVPYARHSLSSAAIFGNPIAPDAPEPGQVLQWNGTAWSPTSLSAPARRRFYLRNAPVAGNAPLTNCPAGFHMASIFELLDVSSLHYDTTQPNASLRQDMGSGPPAGNSGWIRTGSGSATVVGGIGANNCAVWTSNDPGHNGTAAFLTNDPTAPATMISPWQLSQFPCSQTLAVWCIED